MLLEKIQEGRRCTLVIACAWMCPGHGGQHSDAPGEGDFWTAEGGAGRKMLLSILSVFILLNFIPSELLLIKN